MSGDGPEVEGPADAPAGIIDPAVLAAIVAAVDAAWPRAAGGQGPAPVEPARWRFSSRWWSTPVAGRRLRPW